MRQLLGRKSNVRRLGDDENPNSRPVAHLPQSDAAERVFPIRNLRGNGDAPWLPQINRAEGLKLNDGQHTDSSHTASRSDTSPASSENGGSSRGGDGPETRKITERSKFLFLNSGPINVLPGTQISKDGTSYRRCEDEPIRCPGAIQTYGALLGLKYSAHGQLEVRIASENTRKILGYGPEHLFTLPSFLDILRPDGRGEMTARINHALRNVDALKEETRLDVFQIFLTFPYEPEIRLWCALHLAPSPANMVILEFEEYLDAFYLNDMRVAKTLPETPVRHMHFDVTAEEFEKSTTVHSKPLPVLEIARTRKNKEFSSLDIFNAMSQAQQQISTSKSVQDLMDVTVGIVNELTGFHRVMFYRFDEHKNGCVDAELVNPRACVDVFRGMHFPAADIPKQARELYIINRIRILHDRASETARLVCRDESDIKQPLDLTHAYLRAMSPVHNKYLANMSVRSTLSISIVIDGDLWGLVACHGYGDAGIRVSLPIRELCRSIGECVSSNIKQLLQAQRLQVRRPPPVNPVSQTPASYLAASATDLLNLVDADFALLSIEEEARAIGRLDPYQEALAIMSYLQTCRFNEIQSSTNINKDFPGIIYPPGINTIAGLLIVPFNIGGLNDFMVFFRKGQMKEVKWAGNPYEKALPKPGCEYLDPRGSFERWTETIVGTSREWTGDQLDTAQVLSLVYGRFVEIWRQKGSGTPGDKMSQICASSRELRNPANTIAGYLEMALENKIDNKTRHFLTRAQEASNSLTTVVENLSKLTDTEEGAVQPGNETFNLNLTVSRLTKALQKEAHRKALDLTITVHEQLPSMVKGDSDKFKHLVAHLTSNAFKKATSVKVDINLISTKIDTSVVGLRVQDIGPGMTEAELDNTFQELEHAQDDDDWLFASEDSKSMSNKSELTSDLTAIGKYVRNANGQIRVTSEIGKGTIFSIEIPFEHAKADSSTMPKRLKNLFLNASASIKDKSQPSTSAATTTKSTKHVAPRAGVQRDRRVEAAPVAATQNEIRSPSRMDMQAGNDNGNGPNPRTVTYEALTLSEIGSRPRIDLSENQDDHHPKRDTYENAVSPENRSSSRVSMIKSEKGNGLNSTLSGAFDTILEADIRSPSRANTNSAEKDNTLTPRPSFYDTGTFGISRSMNNNSTQNHAPQAPERHNSILKNAASSPFPASTSPSTKDFPSPYGSRRESMQPAPRSRTTPSPEPQIQKPAFSLNMLVADDNFVTQRMLDKQLSQLGHSITIACDGQECHDQFVAGGPKFDIILMDLKMPLVDGALSTKMIRFWEKESSKHRPPPGARDRDHSPKARVPIIAVSASLGDDGKFECIQNGFDGWLQKPIDFATMNLLLTGVKDRTMKRDALYVPGGKGGWFFP